jgi:aspartate/methionine/tyrosine aminotransferase
MITEKTKILLVNNPHNPTGKLLTYKQLEQIAEIVEEHPNLMVVTDEVYEHIIFDNLEMARFANVRNMFDRTITVSSAGKTFCCTGWKVGWAVAPVNIIKSLMII